MKGKKTRRSSRDTNVKSRPKESKSNSSRKVNRRSTPVPNTLEYVLRNCRDAWCMVATRVDTDEGVGDNVDVDEEGTRQDDEGEGQIERG